MNENIKKMRFFLKSDALKWSHDKNDDLCYEIPDSRLVLDIIDQPFCCVVKTDNESIEIKLYNRLGIMLDENFENPEFTPDFSIKLYNDDRDAELVENNIKADSDTLKVLYSFATCLSACIAEKGLVDEFSDMDTDKEGVIVTIDGDDVSFKRVSGRKRPAMLCRNIFEGYEMSRPYIDEMYGDLEDDSMTLEEKIELAEAGDEYMMQKLGVAYFQGDEVEKNPEQSAYWFTKLAECDDSTGQYNLGLFYAKGFGVNRDFEKAVYWLEKSADNGDIDAPVLLEHCTKAVEASKKIADGDAQAQADLAKVLTILASDFAVTDNEEEEYKMAFELAEKSAEQNNGDGTYLLALAYDHGRGVEEDDEKAVELYKKGHELGHAPSTHNYASCIYNGKIVEQDDEKAFKLFMEAAQKGYPLSLKAVGECYQNGIGVDDDMESAIEWYEKYLEIEDDPDLEQKVMVYKLMGEDGLFSLDDEDDEDDYDDDDSDYDDDDYDEDDEEDEELDAFLVAQLFEEDFVFNNDDEISYDGTHTTISGLQFNEEKLEEYPALIDNAESIGMGVVRVMMFVEENTNLMISKKDFHKNLLKATRGYPITGMTIFGFIALHMIKITENDDNKYSVIVDTNLIKGIPDAFAFLGEFIKTLRAYNEIYEDFEVSFFAMKNFNGACKDISEAVKGAETTMNKTITVSGEN